MINFRKSFAAGSADELKDQYVTNCLRLLLHNPESFIKEHLDLEFKQTDRMLKIKSTDISSTLDLLEIWEIIDFEYQKVTLDDVLLNLTVRRFTNDYYESKNLKMFFCSPSTVMLSIFGAMILFILYIVFLKSTISSGWNAIPNKNKLLIRG